MAERNASVPQDKRIEVRIGINLGEVPDPISRMMKELLGSWMARHSDQLPKFQPPA